MRTWYGFKFDGPCGVGAGTGSCPEDVRRWALGTAGEVTECVAVGLNELEPSGRGGEVVPPAPSRAKLAGCGIRLLVLLGTAEVEDVCTGPAGGEVASALPFRVGGGTVGTERSV